MDVYVIADDPCLEQYEFSLYKERDERDAIQKKTFGKWVNKHLVKASKGIRDLFEDLRDGDCLISLLEVLSGESLPRERGRMRVHMLQNIQIALNFLQYKKIKLVNIRPDDIVDGNPKLTLGLIWTIILHYQISDIIQHDDSVTFKEALLRWAQRTTEGYPGVRITDFTRSFRDGLAFNAIIHRNRPDLIDFRACQTFSARENLDSMFRIAERDLGVTRLLDPEDVDTNNPDEKSIITYLSSLYELFPEPCPRNPLLDDEKIRRIEDYKDAATRMVRWITESTVRLRDRNWPNTIHELKMVQTDHNRFRMEEIPPKLHEKQRLTHAYREVTRLAMELDMAMMIEHELSSDNLDIIWNRMMAAHQERDQALIDELLHQEKLQRLADKVTRELKSCDLRLDDIDRNITEEEKRVNRLDPRDAKFNIDQIASDLKIEGDRIVQMMQDVRVLQDNHYHKCNELAIKVESIHKRWSEMGFVFKTRVIEALQLRRAELDSNLQKRTAVEANIRDYTRDANSLIDWINKITFSMKSRSWPNDSQELAMILDDHHRFKKQEIPPKLKEKQILAQAYRDISRAALNLDSPIHMEHEISADNIDVIWNRMMAAIKEREIDLDNEVSRLQKVDLLAEKVARDLKTSDKRLTEIEIDIADEEKRVQTMDPNTTHFKIEQITSDLKVEGDRIIQMRQDVKSLQDHHHQKAHELSIRVESAHKRWSELGHEFRTRVIDALQLRREQMDSIQQARMQVQQDIAKYTRDARALIDQITKTTSSMKSRSWPNDFLELSLILEDHHQFKEKEISPMMKDKQILAQTYHELNRVAMNLDNPIHIDYDITAEAIDVLWNRMMAAIKEREIDLEDEVSRLQKVHLLAEKVARDLKTSNKRLTEIEIDIADEEKRVQTMDPNTTHFKIEQITSDLKVEGDRIIQMRQDVKSLQDHHHQKAHELSTRVESAHKRWSELGLAFKTRVIDALQLRREQMDSIQQARMQAQQDIAAYTRDARSLIDLITKTTSSMKSRSWPKDFSELTLILEDHHQFKEKEIPPMMKDKQILAQAYHELNRIAMNLDSPIRIDHEISAEAIDVLWNRMMAAIKEREIDLENEVARLQKVHLLAEKVARELKTSDKRLTEIEIDIADEEKRVQTMDPNTTHFKIEQITSDLKVEGDRIIQMRQDVKSLQDHHHHQAHELSIRVESAHKRWSELGHEFRTRVIEALQLRREQMDSIQQARMQVQQDIAAYTRDARALIDQITKTTSSMKSRSWPNDFLELSLILEDHHQFKEEEIPPMMKDKQILAQAYHELSRVAMNLDNPIRIDNDISAEAIDILWTNMMDAIKEREIDLEDEVSLLQLLSWLDDVDTQMGSSKPVGGLPETAREQLDKFMELFNQIEQQRPQMESVVRKGNDLISRSSESSSANLSHLMKTFNQKWDHVTSRAQDRKIKLEIALREAIEFHEALTEFVDWLTSAEKHLQSLAPVSRVLDTVNIQMTEHKSFQADVSTHREVMLALDKKGTHLKYFSQKQDVILIKNMMHSVQHRWERVISKASERARSLDHGLKEASDFQSSWSDLITWLKEAERSLDEVTTAGNSPDKIRQMLIKHKEFQRLLGSKQTSYDACIKMGRILKDKAPRTDHPILQDMMDDLKNRWMSVCSKSVDRQRKLEESLLFSGQFREAVDALIDWLDMALGELALDRLHGDLDTVTSLVEQHRSFQEDLKSRSKQLQSVKRTGSDLLASASAEDSQLIRSQLTNLDSKWEEVSRLSSLKESRLQDALRSAEQLHKQVHSLLEWLSDAETRLRSANSLPDDEESTRAQIHEHEKVSREMITQEVAKDAAISLAQDILSKCHPDAIATINHWIGIIQSRWQEVSQWIKMRETKLRDHLASLKDITDLLDELMAWLRRKESDLHTAESIPLPDDIPSIERLIDQHQKFMDDLQARQSEVDRVAKAFTIKRGQEEPRRVGIKHRGIPFSPANKATPRTSSSASNEPDIRSPRARELLDKWAHVWALAQDRMRRLQERLGYVTEMERMKNFDFDEWRRRFLAWLNNKKARIMDFYRKIDSDNDCKVTQNELIEGFLKSSFPTSRLEMERVAPIFDRNGDGYVDHKEYLETLRANTDYTKTEDELIQDEVQKQVSKCTCSIRYKVFHVGEGKYRFGESQKLRLVRILRSTVMVRVGGGWVSLDEFLVKNDPCRAKGRTNVELREQFILADGVSQAMTPFVSKMRTPSTGRQEIVNLPTQGPITKIREKTERSIPMYSQRRLESTSDYSAGGTDSRPRSRLTGTGTGTASGSRPSSRSASRGPSSRPQSRANSDMSTESIEGYSKSKVSSRPKFSTTASGLRRTPSGSTANGARERWK